MGMHGMIVVDTPWKDNEFHEPSKQVIAVYRNRPLDYFDEDEYRFKDRDARYGSKEMGHGGKDGNHGKKCSPILRCVVVAPNWRILRRTELNQHDSLGFRNARRRPVQGTQDVLGTGACGAAMGAVR